MLATAGSRRNGAQRHGWNAYGTHDTHSRDCTDPVSLPASVCIHS